MSSPRAGIISPIEMAPRRAIPSQNKRSPGRWKKLRTVVANRTVRLKLRTSPAMMTKGREREPVEPPATTTGITGTMQGDRPVIRPPRSATKQQLTHGRRSAACGRSALALLRDGLFVAKLVAVGPGGVSPLRV